MTVPPHIGTLREKPLHAALKHLFSEQGDRTEVPVDGFVIDLVRGDLLIEIQTRGFSSMKKKLAALLDAGHSVRIVYPVPVNKWIVKMGDGGEVLSRRRSPLHGDVTDVFTELVSFPELISHAGLEIEVVLTDQEERRIHTPGKSWRRKGWTVAERALLETHGTVRLTSVADVVDLLPPSLPDEFTTTDLAKALKRPRRIAQQMAYCLRKAEIVEIVGKEGNALVYRLS